MPYRLKLDQALASQKWYLANKATVIARKHERRALRRAQLTFEQAQRKERLARLDESNRNVFLHPRKRICLIRQCDDCQRFAAVRWTRRAAYGDTDFDVSHRYIWDCSFSSQDRCNDCQSYDGMVSKILPCDHCGAFRKDSPTGVLTRWHPHTDYQVPSLCVSCWNRARPTWARLREAEETRLFINRIKREVADVSKDQQFRSA